mmetsp:Transcript_3694/g.10442  ORF Transcript_3694/g.10442 Transcript_3694/m.10442 type:complete len:239 (+) Transcript_3694:440-1156(+)
MRLLVLVEGEQVTRGNSRAQRPKVGESVLIQQRPRCKLAKHEACGDEVHQAQTLVLEAIARAVLKRVHELFFCLLEVGVEHGQAPDIVLVGDLLRHGEVVKGREARAVHGAYEVCAQAEVVHPEVDLEELVNYSQGAPLLGGLQGRAISDGDSEGAVEDARGLLQAVGLFALGAQLRVREKGKAADGSVYHLQGWQEPLGAALLEDAVKGGETRLLVRARLHKVALIARCEGQQTLGH